jgi:hypothetical protein
MPGDEPPHDVLVLTEFDYLEAMLGLRADVMARTRGRVLCPASGPSNNPGSRAAMARRARARLHAVGFLEVSLLARRRHGAAVEVCDVTHRDSDGHGHFTVASHRDPHRLRPNCWLVADRVPRRAR